MPCGGNPQETCGGAWLNNVYDVHAWVPYPPLPSNAVTPREMDPSTPPRLWLPSAAGTVPSASTMKVTAMLLTPTLPLQVTFYSRALGVGAWAKTPCTGSFTPSGTCTAELTLPPSLGTMEYYVQAEFANIASIVWPASAPALSMTTAQI